MFSRVVFHAKKFNYTLGNYRRELRLSAGFYNTGVMREAFCI